MRMKMTLHGGVVAMTLNPRRGSLSRDGYKQHIAEEQREYDELHA